MLEKAIADKDQTCLLSILSPSHFILVSRLSYIWPAAAAALGCALQQNAALTWPLLLKQLQTVQHSFLTNTGAAIPPGELISPEFLS